MRPGETRWPSDLIRQLACVDHGSGHGRPAGAPFSRPRPRFLGLEPVRGEAAAKGARENDDWADFYYVFSLKNYEMGIGLHSIGPKSFELHSNGPKGLMG